jgi:hypothetical protein
LPIGRGGRRRGLLHGVEGGGGEGSGLQPLSSLLDFLQTEVIEHLLEQQEGCHVREDGAKVFEILVQPAQDFQHENAIGDVDTKIGEGVGEALHLPTVVIDAEVTLNEAPESGIDVEGTSFTVVEEVALQCQPGITSRVAALSDDVLQAREMVPQIHNLMNLSIRSQAGTLTDVVSSSTWSERE